MSNIKDILNNAEVREQLKPKKYIKHYFPILSKGLYDSVQIDLMDMSNLGTRNKNYNWLLCCVDIFSRKAWVEPMKKKNNKSVVEAMSKVLEQQSFNKVQCDMGSEFISKQFKKLMSDHNIEIIYASAGDHSVQGIVERFNRSLRSLIMKYLMAEDKYNYIDVLPQIVDYYNDRYHSGIQGIPNSPNIEKINEINEHRIRLAKGSLTKFTIGQKVRVLLQRKHFDKSNANWSKTIHTITAYNPSGLSYLIENGNKYKYYELLPTTQIEKPVINDMEVVKNERTIKRRIAKEGIEQNEVAIRRSERERRPNQLEDVKYGKIRY